MLGAMELWPLPPERAVKLERLGELARRLGTERFLALPLVRADERDYPDPWEPTLARLRGLVLRTSWLAYTSFEVAIDDQRAHHARATHTRFTLVAAAPGRAEFRLAAIGKDDVAGAVALEVSHAVLALDGGDPFREGGAELPSVTDGSLASVVLGLGVLVANWFATRPRPTRTVVAGSPPDITADTRAELLAEDVAMLLAVQDLVRETPQPDALATLRGPAASHFEVWRAALAPHRDELRATLGLAEVEPRTLERPPAPAVSTVEDREPDNRGKRTFRIPSRGGPLQIFAGMVVGAAGLALGVLPGILLIGAGSAVGAMVGGRFWICSSCATKMRTVVPVCPGCGGTIAGELANLNLRLEREEELDEMGTVHTNSTSDE